MTVILRMVMPKATVAGRARQRFALASILPKNGCARPGAVMARNADPRVDHLFDPPLAVIGNSRPPAAESMPSTIDGLPLVLRPLRTHERGAAGSTAI